MSITSFFSLCSSLSVRTAHCLPAMFSISSQRFVNARHPFVLSIFRPISMLVALYVPTTTRAPRPLSHSNVAPLRVVKSPVFRLIMRQAALSAHKSFCAECVSLAGTFVLCIHSTCPSHRHPETHNCPSQPIDAIPSKSQSSAVIQKSSRLRSAKPPTDPAKLLQWRKMEVMKMRHRAVCGDPKDKTASLPPDQRLHVKIHFQDADKVFWFRKVRDFQRLSAIQLFQSLKNVVTGRALDLLVNQLGLTFPESTEVRLPRIRGITSLSATAASQIV
jgi:hypothetical protein